MGEIGIIRDIDNLGRIVIPKEWRTLYKLDGDVEVVPTTDGILIRNPKYILVERTDSTE